MPVPIDASHPFRRLSELMQLVTAVCGADDNDEARWIEWKRTLDLTTATAIRHLAKQILGFANRDPQMAAAWADGYAYLVVGASPRTLMGVTPIDPERLVSQIQPYVGSDIMWTPEYVDINGTRVLVIIVNPPCSGDSIHALRKDLDRYRAGTIFIRRPGQTVQADADEIRMLEQRVLWRASQIDLTVEPLLPAIEAWPDFDDLLDSWARDERERCLVARHNADEPAAIEGFRLASTAMDARSPDEYANQIDCYLEKAKRVLTQRIYRRLFDHEPSMLLAQALNHTQRNFTQVEVTFVIDGGSARAFDRELMSLINQSEQRFPEPPPPIGTPKTSQASTLPDFGIQDRSEASTGPRAQSVLSHEWKVSSTVTGVRITLQPRDVRTQQATELPRIPFGVFAKPGSTITVQWIATATNADGRATGSFALSVLESSLIEI